MDSENKIRNDVVYLLGYQDVQIGSWYRTGEPMERTYHVFDKDENEIGHVTRFRYLEGVYLALVKEYVSDLLAAQMEAPVLAAEIEEFLKTQGINGG